MSGYAEVQRHNNHTNGFRWITKRKRKKKKENKTKQYYFYYTHIMLLHIPPSLRNPRKSKRKRDCCDFFRKGKTGGTCRAPSSFGEISHHGCFLSSDQWYSSLFQRGISLLWVGEALKIGEMRPTYLYNCSFSLSWLACSNRGQVFSRLYSTRWSGIFGSMYNCRALQHQGPKRHGKWRGL